MAAWVLPVAMAAAGAISSMSKKGGKATYALPRDDRAALAAAAKNQLIGGGAYGTLDDGYRIGQGKSVSHTVGSPGAPGGIYGSDPNTFWGQNIGDWGQRSGIGGLDGGMDISSLWGGGGGGRGGGGGGAKGYSAKGFAATGYGANAEYVDMGDESMQMLPSERIRQNVYGAQERRGTAQTQNAIRRLRERETLTGGIGSPAQAWMEAQMEIENRNQQAEMGNQFETDFSAAAGQRRAGGLMNNSQVGTQASIATAANKTNASMATAGNMTSASIATAGNRTQASSVNAGLAGQAAAREQQGRMFALGLWDKNQDRDLDRYRLLNDMNMGWQQPLGSQPGGQSGLGKAVSGAGAGIAAYYGAGGTYGLGGYKAPAGAGAAASSLYMSPSGYAYNG